MFLLSLPMRERGLKFVFSLALWVSYVAPHAGAWIEIGTSMGELLRWMVAPHAGAWIEMPQGIVQGSAPRSSLPMRERGLKCKLDLNRFLCNTSLPMRERGLKYSNYQLAHDQLVAPHAGAWIEIELASGTRQQSMGSLPMRERGLKYGHDFMRVE